MIAVFLLCALAAQPQTILVNAGGGTWTDSLGQTWAADYGFDAGLTFGTAAAISNTVNPVLYQSQHWNTGPFSYQFALPNGTYNVSLWFAELYWNAPSRRVFSIALNGDTVEPNLDVFAATGAKFRAMGRTYPVSVADGQLTISFGLVTDFPIVNSIEIRPANSATPSAETVTGIALYPGDNLQAAVASNPPGTTFILKSGTHRLQMITPKDNDVFVGEPGTVLNGAQVLTNFTQAGRLWATSGQTQRGPAFGECDDDHPMCGYPEDLFIDDHVVPKALSLSALTSGYWYFDYDAATIYLADNPAGHTVETSVAGSAFSGSASNVTIDGLTVEKYAAPTQFGAIGGQYPGPGWTVQNNEVRLNHGAGIQLGSNATALHNFVHHNGMKGIGTTATSNVTVNGNELSFNSYAGYALYFEGGGAKFSSTNNLTVVRNYSHDNNGPGLWTDTDNFNTLYDGNRLINNATNGIQHEVSFSAIIRNNFCQGNGPNPNWLWQSQIVIQNSQSVEVYNNTVIATAANGNGIGIISQNRGGGSHGPWLAINNYIHDNSITYQAGSIANSGIVADYNEAVALNGSNHFDYNAYHVTNPAGYLWQWNGYQTFSAWQALGQDTNATIDTNVQ